MHPLVATTFLHFLLQITFAGIDLEKLENKEGYVYIPGVLTKEEADDIIDFYDGDPRWVDPSFLEADGKPAQQVDFLMWGNWVHGTQDKSIAEKLWHPYLFRDQYLCKIYLRKYFPSARVDFPVHVDPHDVSVVVLLSDQYSDSGLYLFPPELEEEMALDVFEQMSYEDRKDFIERYKVFTETLVLPMTVGDMVIFNATTWHGVLPVSEGSRHTLIMNMANKVPINGKKNDCDWHIDFPLHGNEYSNSTALPPRIDLYVDWVERVYGKLANRYATPPTKWWF